MALLELEKISCAYGDTRALADFSLEVEQGEIAALLGPSGCGKTTTLRAVLGFEPVLQGEIRIAGEVMSRPGFSVLPERRPVGMVFQDRALFPHLTVAQNIGIGIRRGPKPLRSQVVGELLEIIGLNDCAARFPHELSGGQQERVALARALAPRPRLLLLDEPFACLDIDLRERLGFEVRDILKETGSTAVVVTHDQDEAFAIGDQVGIMEEGVILQWDTPFNIYHRPVSRQVASLVGRGVFIEGVLREEGAFDTEIGRVQNDHTFPHPLGTRMDILLRPDDVQIDSKGEISATVVKKAFKGSSILYTLRLAPGTQLLALAPSHKDLEIDEQTRLSLDLEHLVAFPRAPEE
ncbi:MAG: ABC transporter ATP-binding protein [Gammaproteobacteria bacterium]|nr:ABC transporter ATP-binding protein [Gammaproteobacteria bacterium]